MKNKQSIFKDSTDPLLDKLKQRGTDPLVIYLIEAIGNFKQQVGEFRQEKLPSELLEHFYRFPKAIKSFFEQYEDRSRECNMPEEEARLIVDSLELAHTSFDRALDRMRIGLQGDKEDRRKFAVFKETRNIHGEVAAIMERIKQNISPVHEGPSHEGPSHEGPSGSHSGPSQ